MELERKDIHELKNHLSISMGMCQLAQKMIAREGKEVDLTKLNDRIEKSLLAQQKILEFLESLKKPTPTAQE